MKTRPLSRIWIPLLLAMGVLIGGCAGAINKKMNSWMGRHQSELIQAWGPPRQTVSDGNGGSILVYGSYVNLGQNPGTAVVDPYGNLRYTAPQQRGYSRTRMFYVDPNGIIYYWRWAGL